MNLSKTRVVVCGVNRMRLLKNIVDNGIMLENVENSPSKWLKFTIKSTDKAKTFAILKKLCYNYSVEWDFGILSVLKRLLLRSGVALGLALSLTACVIASQLVFFVKVNKIENVDEKAVIQAVESVMSLPSRKNRLSLDKIKQSVDALSGVAMCNVSVKGNYVIVDAIGFLPEKQRFEKDKIVASHDAVITKIAAKSGTAVRKVGDVVKKGDELISGKIMTSDGAAVLREVCPEGEVWGKVTLSSRAVFPSSKVIKQRTGRQKVQSKITFGNRPPKLDSPYERCDTTIEKTPINIFIPLNFTKITFYETVFIDVAVNVQSQADEMKAQLCHAAMGKLIDSRTTIKDLGGGLSQVDVHVIMETIISN